MTDCNDSAPPSRCMEAFNAVTEKLGGMSAKLDAIHDQAVRTNGHVESLFQRTGRHETQIQLLRAETRGRREGADRWTKRVWQLLIGLALLLAGYLFG